MKNSTISSFSFILMLFAILCVNAHYLLELSELENLFTVTWGVIFFAAQVICLALNENKFI